MMPTDYQRSADQTTNSVANTNPIGSSPDEAAMEDAAEALRQAEVEAVQPEALSPRQEQLQYHEDQLETLSIDDLRMLAKELDVPDRATITDQDELIAAIRRCL